VFGQVGAALEFRHDPHDREEVAQISRHRRLEDELTLGRGLDLGGQQIDHAIAIDQLSRFDAVVVEQALGRCRQRFTDQREEPVDANVDLLKVAVEMDPKFRGDDRW
jgi:hypothetical protein